MVLFLSGPHEMLGRHAGRVYGVMTRAVLHARMLSAYAHFDRRRNLTYDASGYTMRLEHVLSLYPWDPELSSR